MAQDKIMVQRAEIVDVELERANSGGGKNKEERMKEIARNYLFKSYLLLLKLQENLQTFPLTDEEDLATILSAEVFL